MRGSRKAAEMFAVASLLLSGTAVAQTAEQEFDVVVEPPIESRGQVGAQGSIAIGGSSLQMRSVQRVANVIRDRKPKESEEEETQEQAFLQLSSLSISGLVSTSDADEVGSQFGRWNLFADFNYATGEQDVTLNAPSYDIDGYGLTAGADYRVSDRWVVGGLVTGLQTENQFENAAGLIDQTSLGFALLSVWYPTDHWYFDAIARYAVSTYDVSRLTPSGVYTAAEPDGDDSSLGLGTGYLYQQGALSLTPKARLVFIAASIDGYDEGGQAAPADRLRYSDQEAESFTSNVGFDVAYNVNTSWGVVVPQGSVEWVYDFTEQDEVINAQQIQTGTPAVIAADERDDNFFRVGLGGIAILPRGNILFGWFEAEPARSDRTLYSLTLGYRLEF